MKRALIPLLIFVGLVGVLAVGLTLNPSEVPSPLIGKPVPEFTAPRLHQPERTLSNADFRGEVSVVNVFASWCPPCRDEHPYISALAERVPVYGINYKDTREDAIAWLQRFGNAYRAIAFDPDGKTGLDWGVYGVPETFIVDRAGVIRHKHVGPVDARTLREELFPLIQSLRAEAR